MKIGSLDISSIKVGNSDCSVYIGDTKIYPTSPQPTGQTPCYAVVDDISQYHSSDFVDVFNLSDGDWYKLNDQGFFEKYGIYGEGRDPYGPGESRLPNGYVELDYIQNPNNSFAYIDTGFKPNQDTRIKCVMQIVDNSKYGRFIGSGVYNQANAIQFDYEDWYNGSLHISWGHRNSWLVYSSVKGDYNVHEYDWNKNSFYIDGSLVASEPYTNFSCTDNLGIFTFIQNGTVNSDTNGHMYGKLYSFQLYDDGTLIMDLVPAKRTSDNKVGVYDIVNDQFYLPPNVQSYQFVAGNEKVITSGVTTYNGKLTLDDGYEYEWNGSSWISQGEITGTTYPVYYDDVQDPPQNITFATMQEALAYQCPYVGLYATIDGDLYVFNSNYEWESLVFTLTGVTTSNESFNLKINGTDNQTTIFRDNGDNTYDWGLVYTSPITNVSDMCSGNTAIKTFDWYDADVSSLTSIGDNAFRDCSGLTSITIPSGVTSIGNYTFQNCRSLTSITIPSGVTSIGSYAFYYCRIISSFTIPSSVTSIGSHAFEHWDLLRDITIPSGITTLNSAIFQSCGRLSGVTIPDSVTSIGDRVFNGCSSLSSITIPSGVTSIGQYAFNGCSNLTNINIPSGVTIINNYTFQNCRSLTSITIPSGVTSIGSYAFNACSGLTSITIPDRVTSVGAYAFQNCKGITSLTIPDSVTTINNWGFAYLESVTSLTIGSGVTTIGRQALCGYKQNESITVSPNNTKFNSNNNCNAVIETARNKLVVACKNTVIPNTVTIIGEAAYQGCTGLTSIELSENITALDFAAFYECVNLTSLTIHATTPPTLGNSALQKTNNNLVIYVPASSVEAYKTASGWSSYASRIQPIS